MAEEYDVDKIVGDVEKAVLAGKSRPATEKESFELRLAALENIVRSCKELVEKIYSDSSLFQNPVGFEQALGKTGQKSGFSTKFKEAVPKTEVLEQPHSSKMTVK